MIIQGDCLEELKKLPTNYVDTLITDPPYGLSFMGKKWDYDVPSVEVWSECLRVLKPGGTALIFAGSRTQHRMAVNVEDAGFILKDCIMWLYGSGFPKATDISKQLDKGHERKVVGKWKPQGTAKHGACTVAGENLRPNLAKDEFKDITEPATPEAKLWNGWKSHGLKPAYEPILVAMKPNEGTYANNALTWGVSGLNIDGGRIGTKTRTNSSKPKADRNGFIKGFVDGTETEIKNHGRFPANLILDEEAGRLLDEQSGESKSSKSVISDHRKASFYGGGGVAGERNPANSHSDKGGASRFFYCAKASKAERNAGCEGLDDSILARSGGAQQAEKKGEEYDEAQGIGLNRVSTMKNNHPTVKPLALMEYLCTLTATPTKGIVLDPFAGSGTTGLATKNTGRDYILIERESEYIEIIKARLQDKQTKLML